MSTKRQVILERIGEIIRGITSDSSVVFKHVSTSKIPPVSLETVALPACFVYSGAETKVNSGSEAAIGSETWSWIVTLEVWGQDSVMESLLNLIHSAMYNDYTFNNNAEWSERIGVDFLIVDPTQQLEVMLINYNVIYRHTLGDMGG